MLDLLHRQSLRLVHRRAIRIPAILLVQAKTGTAAELLRAHRGNVDEQKPAFNRGRLGALNRFVDRGVGLDLGYIVGRFHWEDSSIPKGQGPKAQGRRAGQGLSAWAWTS